jgi:hypothetical protein
MKLTTADLPCPRLGSSIGHSRFLKTIKAAHPNGPLVVKVFVKADPSLSLLVHRRRLKGACVRAGAGRAFGWVSGEGG